MAAGLLTLTTDFGADGPYVAALKGVVLSLAPTTRIVDVSHAIEPQNVAQGAFVLGEILEFYPSGTVHLCVVDPGVGTNRRIIAVEALGQFLVAPDNGLIDGALAARDLSRIWEVTNPSHRRATVSTTFHGRDIMAPAVAHLLNGGDPSELGPALANLVRLPATDPVATSDGLVGQVVFRDSFGNLITNIHRDLLNSDTLESWVVVILGQSINGLISTYADRSAGSLVALIGSSNRLEVAVVNGNAAFILGAGARTPVVLRQRGASV